jgi:phage-related protein
MSSSALLPPCRAFAANDAGMLVLLWARPLTTRVLFMCAQEWNISRKELQELEEVSPLLLLDYFIFCFARHCT